MHFEHLIEINDPHNPLIETLNRRQVWDALFYRVHEPGIFLPGLERCEILSSSAARVERLLHFGQVSIRDTVTFMEQVWLCFESAANGEHAGGQLTIRIEEPEDGQIFLRFTYETSLPEGITSNEGVQVSEFVKSAYRQSDLDTARAIRMIALNGRPQ
ncbi:SRPBCC family protein [Zoogloea sp.]|uniref:SRPBCC family protein n=1 Tax=Zoogloea sp. TaxID=49181 RepID=UPI002635D8F0|nr:SRPBCC family protein [Zoogloea sp.]MDD3352955.1 SRPBCC family protein [Zoogloea sp.]